MYYLLHHSKGTLLLSADDKHQVVEWSKRQLTNQAGPVSVIETEISAHDDMVERSGTGLKARESSGCRPMISFMADSAQYLTEHQEQRAHCSESHIEFQIRASKPVWH
jgi:hypothetical protein